MNQYEQLLSQKPSNSDLTYILRWCNDADIRNKALETLRQAVGYDQSVNESELIKNIAS